jgi:hypothetical protein
MKQNLSFSILAVIILAGVVLALASPSRAAESANSHAPVSAQAN